MSAVLLALAPLGFAQGTPVDLNTWVEEGPSNNGTWNVEPDGSSVLQTVNGNPTFFVSPNTFFNTSVNGQFGVETTVDDDYIGFVFGYQTPNPSTTDQEWDFLLFDWKQGNQSGSVQGFTLAKVDGATCTTECAPFANHQTSQSGSDWSYEVLATNADVGLGWADNTTYDFELLYEVDRIRITITGGTGIFQNGLTVFDVTATPEAPLGSLSSFPDGRFGFYNYSQQSVRYAGFIQNNGPTAVTDDVNVDEDDSVTFNVLTNDTDPNLDPLSLSAFTMPSFGTLTNDGSGSFTYEPNDDYCGSDAFGYTVTDGEFTDDGTVAITVDPVNDDPVIGSLTGDLSGDAGDTFGYTGSATDLDAANGCGGSTLTYSYDFGDGSPGQSGVDLTSVDHIYASAGQYTLTLTVTDGAGGLDLATLSVTVDEVVSENTPPVITSLDGDRRGDEGDAFAYTASATDSDGDPLTYSYAFGDGTPGQSGVDLTSVSHVYASAGQFTLTLTVTDGRGGSTSDTLNVTVDEGVAENIAPVITSLTGDQTGDEGTTFGYMATAMDEDGDPLTYTYSFGDGTPGQSGVDLSSVSHVYASAGLFTLTLTVTDGRGGSDTETLTVTVTELPDGNPDITIELIPVDPPIVIAPGQRVTFDLVLTNNGASTEAFDLWVELELPDGSFSGREALPMQVQLLPGQSTTSRIARRLYRFAPEGLYTYRSFVGEFSTMTVYDQDAFTFEARVEAATKNGAPYVSMLGDDHVNGGVPSVARVVREGELSHANRLGDEVFADFLALDIDPDVLVSDQFLTRETAPDAFAIHGSHPNPFSASAEIAYDLAASSHVVITVYDVRGRRVAVLTDGEQAAGRYTATFDAQDLPSGLYLARVVAGGEAATVRMVLAK